jgi:hypothetical protein
MLRDVISSACCDMWRISLTAPKIVAGAPVKAACRQRRALELNRRLNRGRGPLPGIIATLKVRRATLGSCTC